MKQKNLLTVIIVLSILLIAYIVWGMGGKPGKQSCPVQGEPSLDFTLVDLEGNQVRLIDHLGKVVFLNFWASWCPPCRAEMPSMQKLHEKMQGEDFIILAVSIDKGGKSVVKPFIENGGFAFPVLLDPQGRAANKYGVRSIPTTFIIDKSGTIVDRTIGSRDWATDPVVRKFRNLARN